MKVEQNDSAALPDPPKKLNREHDRKKDRMKIETSIPSSHGERDRRRWSKRKMCQLTTKEKISIVHAVVIKLGSNSEVAGKYQVKADLVSRLVCRSKKNKAFMAEL
jgi:hypothetical protein